MTRTAVLWVECQNGVLGPAAALPGLADSVPDLVDTLARLLEAARERRIPVIHATSAGSYGDNQVGTARLWQAVGSTGGTWRPESDASQVLPALLRESDLVLPRHHGLFPTLDTELIPVIKSLGVDHVVLTGVSVNVALPFTAGHLSQYGLHVTVPRDAVGGTPADYTPLALKYSLGMIAQLTTTAELMQTWSY